VRPAFARQIQVPLDVTDRGMHWQRRTEAGGSTPHRFNETGISFLWGTLLGPLGVGIPGSMSGRVIEEALRGGPEIASFRVERVDETVKTADSSYELTAHVSIAAGKRYLDSTDVKRR
jgi:hypothetical protein